MNYKYLLAVNYTSKRFGTDKITRCQKILWRSLSSFPRYRGSSSTIDVDNAVQSGSSQCQLINQCLMKCNRELFSLTWTCNNGNITLRSMCTRASDSAGQRGDVKVVVKTGSKMGSLHGIDTHGLHKRRIPTHKDFFQSTRVAVRDEETPDEGVGDLLPVEDIAKKYPFLSSSTRVRMENVVDMGYGFMRIDSQNMPAGEIRTADEMDNEIAQIDISQDRSPELSDDHKVDVADGHMNDAADYPSRRSTNVFDEQYFQALTVSDDSQKENVSDENMKNDHLSQQHHLSSIIADVTDGHVNDVSASDCHSRSSTNMFDEQYFEALTASNDSQKGNVSDENIKNEPPSHQQLLSPIIADCKVDASQTAPSGNMFDDQYFGMIEEEVQATPQVVRDEQETETNIFEQQFFPEAHDHNSMSSAEGFSNHTAYQDTASAYTKPDPGLVGTDHPNLSNDKSPPKEAQSLRLDKTLTDSVVEPEVSQKHPSSFQNSAVPADGKKKPKKNVRPNLEQTKTAFDLAMKIRLENKGKLQTKTTPSQVSRKWEGNVDSHGFRLLGDQVQNVHNLTENVVVKMLYDNIVYEDDNIVAISKPYGLPSHGGPGIHNSVGKLVEALSEKLSHGGLVKPLHLVHRLDKETTGVMVLAKGENVANTIRDKFKKREVLKKYLVITKGIPNPTEGVIDIPLAEGQVGNKYRMILAPEYNEDTKILMRTPKQVKKYQATTYYRVLDSNYSAALIECQPESGVKHQIRCHLAFGLNCPVLGDHKYSHFSKTAPQRLHSEILQRLGIRQSKARYVPMHLHASALVIPEFREGRNLFLSARLPHHFLQNMKWLKLKVPS